VIIRSVELKNFRNFTQKQINFSDSINVLFGFNGQGKTNLLEAISVSCLSKSFRTRNDGDLVQYDKEKLQISTNIVLDNNVEKNIKVIYSRSNGKNIEIDHTKIKSIFELFGSFPIVILSPEDDIITTGPPQERRRFINFVFALLDKEYLKLVQDYDRTLKQRNKILQDAKESRYKFSEKIEPWNEKLFQLSLSITTKRRDFLLDLEELVQPIHQELTTFLEKFQLRYKPSFNTKWKDFGDFKKELEKIVNEEIMKGNTIIGPHRDEIVFFLDNHDLRKFGSRGQHRSLLLALKIGVYKLISEKKKETPAFLLDDVYSEIDNVREKAFNDYFLDLNQVFITTHDKDIKFDLPGNFDKEVRYIPISNNDLESKNINLN